MSIAATKPTPRLTGLDIDLSKKTKIVHTYSRKQAQPSDHAWTKYESDAKGKPETRLDKRKHLGKDHQKRKPGQSDENEASGPYTPKRAKRKRRLAVEQLVLQPFLPDNHKSLDAQLQAIRIRHETDEPPDDIVTSDPPSPSSRIDTMLEHYRRPNAGSRKPLSIIRNHFVLPRCGQQKPADWKFFLFPPITPQSSGLQPREIGSGFEGRERQLQIPKRPTVGRRKGKRRIQNKRMAPLGFAIVKPNGSEAAEDRQQTPNSSESRSRIIEGDNMEGSNDLVASVVNEETNKQDCRGLDNGCAEIEKSKNPNSTGRKSNQASDIEAIGRVPKVSASKRVLGSEEMLEDSDQLDSTMAMDHEAYPLDGGRRDRNTRETVARGTGSPAKDSGQDYYTGIVRRVSFLHDGQDRRLESLQRPEPELAGNVAEHTILSALRDNPRVMCGNGRDQRKVIRMDSLEVATGTHSSVAQVQESSDREWEVATSDTRGRSVELEGEILDCGSPTLTDHSYCRRQHTLLLIDNSRLGSVATSRRQDSESQHSLLPRKSGWRIEEEIPETPRDPDLEQFVNRNQGSRSPSSFLRDLWFELLAHAKYLHRDQSVPTLNVYDEDGERKGNDEDDFAEVHSMLEPSSPRFPTVLDSRSLPKVAKQPDSSVNGPFRVIRRKSGPRSTIPESNEDDPPTSIATHTGVMPNSSRRRKIWVLPDSQDLRISGRKASVELGSLPTRRKPSLLPFVPPFK